MGQGKVRDEEHTKDLIIKNDTMLFSVQNVQESQKVKGCGNRLACSDTKTPILLIKHHKQTVQPAHWHVQLNEISEASRPRPSRVTPQVISYINLPLYV